MSLFKILAILTYKKFGIFLMFLLALGVIFNGMSTINNLIAIPLVTFLIIAELLLVIIVDFNEEVDTFWFKFLGRFTEPDVLAACFVIILYISGCNEWLDLS